MSDKQINQFKSMNINFRDKLREAYLNNKHEFDDQDNKIIQPILNDVLYSNDNGVNGNNNLRELIKKKWDGLSKDIKDINNSRFDIPSTNGNDVEEGINNKVHELDGEEGENEMNGKYENRNIHHQNKTTTNNNSIKSRIPTIQSNGNKSQVRFQQQQQQQPSKNDDDDEINKLKKTIESLNKKIKHQIIERKDIIEEFQTKEIRIMKNHQNEINKLIKKYETKLKNEQQERQTSNNNDDDDGIVNELRISIDKLNNEIDNKNLQILQFTNQLTNLKDENFHLKQENNRLRYDRNNNNNNNNDNNVSPSKETNQLANSESQELRKMIDNLTKENIELRSQFNQLKNTNAGAGNGSFQYGSVQGDDSDDEVEEEEQEEQEQANEARSRYNENGVTRVSKSPDRLQYDTQQILKKEYDKVLRITSSLSSPPQLQTVDNNDIPTPTPTTSDVMRTAANDEAELEKSNSMTIDLLKVKKEEEIDTTQKMLRKHWH